MPYNLQNPLLGRRVGAKLGGRENKKDAMGTLREGPIPGLTPEGR